MKREILFRGKKEGSNTWMYGMPCRWDDETIGQFTGLNDKHSRKIFEGDIVMLSILGNSFYLVVKWDKEYCNFSLCNENGASFTSLRRILTVNIKIIGNIHDNAELLTAKLDNLKE